MYQRYSFFALLIFMISISSFAQIHINEIMASNSTTIKDANGDFDDWIEIYNSGNLPVNIAGLYISDDPAETTKWQIPLDDSSKTNIAPNQFLILWADSEPDEGLLHLGFKLNASGEFVIITDKDGFTRLDSVMFAEQSVDISWGAQDDGNKNFAFMTPTPGQSNNGSGIISRTEPPVFSLESGFYSGEITVTLSSISQTTKIFYATGGITPDTSSLPYVEPFVLDTSTVIRAIAVESGKEASEVVTNSYLFTQQHTIPVVTFVMDPDSLFDNEVGIYSFGNPDSVSPDWPYYGANFWKDWEKPVHLEFIETNGDIEFEMDAGASIGGNSSRAAKKKTFNINNNKIYGIKELQYKLFPGNPYDTYDGFVLRSGAEERSRLLNELMYEINKRGKHKNAMQASRPVALYINGRYWGNYTLMERKNGDFVKSRYGYDNIDMLKEFDTVAEGDDTAYRTMVINIEKGDASTNEFYDYLQSNINLQSFTDHWIYQIYTSHIDANNVAYWRPREPNGKWQYISYDFDWWSNLGKPPEPYFSTFKYFLSLGTYDYWILGKMMKNLQYRNFFLNRLADMLNTSFKSENVLALIDSINSVIEPEMPRDIERWEDGWEYDAGPTDFAMEWIRYDAVEYANDYPNYIYKEILDTLQIDTVRVNVAKHSGGNVMLNTINLSTSVQDWSGIYFQGTTIKFMAQPYTGNKFSGWLLNNASAGDTTDLSIVLGNTPIQVEAQFQKIDQVIVINEINYNSSSTFDCGDWIELYNPNSTAIDLSGWVYKDNDDAHAFIIPNGITIEANSYYVLAHDSAAFSTCYPNVKNVVTGVDFGLSSSTDAVRILNVSGDPVDAVYYESDSPWPVEANGSGYTLELNNPTNDNASAENWLASLSIGGTPSAPNHVEINAIEPTANKPINMKLAQNYPNPFNPSTVISYQIAKNSFVKLKVFNIKGQEVATLVNTNQSPGNYSINFNARNLASGIYYYRIKAGSFIQVKKMILVR